MSEQALTLFWRSSEEDASMIVIIVLLYLAACAVTGVMGRHTVFGFAGHFFISILITPLIDFLIQVISRPRRSIRRQLEKIGE